MARSTAITGPLEDFVLDAWSSLSHKVGMGTNGNQTAGQSRLVPTWVGNHRKRLTAYVMYQAYVDGVARNFAAAMDLTDRDNYREYGDAKLLRDVLVDALLGDRQEIVVDGAADYDPDLEEAAEAAKRSADMPEIMPGIPPPLLPQLAPIPTTAPQQASGMAASSEEEGPTPEELEENAEAKSAADREEWLRDWADADGFFQALKRCEEDAVALGDAFYALGWSVAENRVTVYDLHNPGFFFPVTRDSLASRGFDRVHLGWEVDRAPDGTIVQVETGSPVSSGAKRFVHKITFELRDLPDGETRSHPWDDPDKPASNRTCYMSDGYWPAPSSAEGAGPDDFAGPAAFYDTNEEGIEVRDLDLGIDFIPVVHVRNTARDEWGESALAPLVQLLDDLAFTDSDLAAASATTGSPPIWTSGGGIRNADIVTYGPGQWYTLPVEGSLHVLDTSQGLVALSNHRDALLSRLSVNARVPASVIGRLSGQASSGIHLALTFGPLAAKVGAMRLVRDPTNSEVLTMVQKLAMARGVLEPGVPHRAKLILGSYLPVDKPSVVEQVAALLTAKAVSREVALRMLIDAGFPIDDAQREVERIEAGDFAGAVALDDATGDRAAVYEYLHRPMPAAPPPAPVQPPVAPILSGPEPAPTGGVGAQPAPGAQPPSRPPQAP